MATHTEKQDTTIQAFHAASLAERLARWQAAETTDASLLPADTASERWKRWRHEAPFNEDGLFDRKLNSLNITEDEFCQVLALAAEDAPAVAEAMWLSIMSQAIRDFADAEPVFPPDASASVDFNLQLSAVNPLLAWGLARLRENTEALNGQMPAARRFPLGTVEAAWLGSIRGQIARMLARTTALELGIAKLQDELQGDTPTERYRDFFTQLGQPHRAAALWNEYPVLARQIVELLDTSLCVLHEFLTHLQADWSELERVFAESELGQLDQLLLSQGDSHAGGHGVIVARFAKGERIVYKPRSLSVESHFQELLQWTNERCGLPEYRTLQMVDRGDHGWVEFVAHAPCTDAAQLRRFYRRQGGLIALFYALQANDLHSQNLIACGEQPVAIDLETLFHPTPFGSDSHPVDRLLHTAHEDSVMKTGILPQRVWSHGGGHGIDISAIGGGERQLAPATTLCWENPGTDEMRVTRDHFEMAAEKNRPALEKQVPSAFEYRHEIQTGFIAMYETLLQHRNELLAEDGPLAKFENDSVRVILRDTRTYAVLLDESYHPDFLRDALDRDKLFDRLWLRVVHQPHLARVIESEQADLRRRDIPAFMTQANSVDLVDGRGQTIAGFFKSSGLEAARSRLRSLSADDLARQLWFVNSSLAILSGGTARKPSTGTTSSGPKRERPTCAMISTAQHIGDRLEQLAIRDDGLAAWFGTSYLGDSWSVDILGLDLYEGLSGLALFLAYLGEVSGDQRKSDLAMATTETLQAFLSEDYQPPGIGGFSGLGGIVYALSHLGALWHRDDLLALAESLSIRHAALIDQDEQLDIVSGTAGNLCGLLSLQTVRPSERVLGLATRCGERLLETARRQADTASWTTAANQAEPLAGMSHGASGIAHALLALHRWCPDRRLLETARAAIAFENTLFSPEQRNWADRRANTHRHVASNSGMMAAWCHGSPGIGLARLSAAEVIDDPVIGRDIVAAIDSTLACGFGNSHSLCHGDLGNLIFLQSAARQMHQHSLQAQVTRLTDAVTANINDQGCRCGIPLDTETPGLMSGLAGIGYGLLHLAEPTRVPNVLTLEPPRNAGRP